MENVDQICDYFVNKNRSKHQVFLFVCGFIFYLDSDHDAILTKFISFFLHSVFFPVLSFELLKILLLSQMILEIMIHSWKIWQASHVELKPSMLLVIVLL